MKISKIRATHVIRSHAPELEDSAAYALDYALYSVYTLWWVGATRPSKTKQKGGEIQLI
jgi:hypothetical protein